MTKLIVSFFEQSFSLIVSPAPYYQCVVTFLEIFEVIKLVT